MTRVAAGAAAVQRPVRRRVGVLAVAGQVACVSVRSVAVAIRPDSDPGRRQCRTSLSADQVVISSSEAVSSAATSAAWAAAVPVMPWPAGR